MTELLPYSSRSGSLEQRRLGRDLTHVSAQTSRAVARVQAAAEIEATKTDAIAHVAQRGMQNVALLSQMESQLAHAVPMASGRLAMLGDFAAMGMAQIVANAARNVRG